MLTGLILASVEAAADPGSNQILQIAGQFGIKPHLLLAQVINFCIVASVLYFFVIKPTQSKLEERGKLIDEGLKRAEESTQRLADAETQKNQIIAEARKLSQGMVDQAQKEMAVYEAQRRTQAQQEASEILERAKRELITEQAQQIAKAQRELGELVVQLAEKSLQETLTPEQKNKFAERVAANLK